MVRVVILWAAGLGAAAQFSKFGLFLPELEQIYPDAGLALGLIVSIVSLIGALFGLVAGALAIQLGLRRLLLMGLTLGAIVSMLQYGDLSLEFLLLSRITEGLSHLAIVVSAPTLIAMHSTTEYRSAAMTLWSTFVGVTFALTGWLGIALVNSQGLSALFLFHGLFMSTIALLVLATIPDDTSEHRVIAGDARIRILSNLITRHKQAWTSPTIAAPAAGWLFYTLTFVALLTLLPALMAAEDRAFTASALPLASLATSLTLGVLLLRRLSAVQVLGVGFIAAILFAMALPAFPTEPLLCIALFAALGLVQGASFGAVPQLNKTSEDQALANGALAQAGNIGNLVGTPLLLSVAIAGGVSAMSALIVLCYLLAIAAHAFLAYRRRQAM